jgi:RecA-family ATPase
MSDRPLIIELIRDSIRTENERRPQNASHSQVPKPEPADDLFTIHSANRWMQLQSTEPDCKMLMGSFWHEQELCILFADTNMGKSILAVQLAHELSRGGALEPFANHSQPANVLYMDFELSPKQFQTRYHEGHATHKFADNLYRAEFNTQAQVPYQYKSFEEYMNAGIEHSIKRTGAEVLIIDNISCLRTSIIERGNEALALMQHLKALKVKYQLSILVLAHTPKRNPANPISRNDLQGSKMLINFADSAFAIGQSSTRPDVRYLKQVKQRSSAETYGAENICLFTMQKQYGYLHFRFEGYAREADHLRRHSHQQRTDLSNKARQLQTDGLTQRKIAAQLKLSLSTVNKLLNWA